MPDQFHGSSYIVLQQPYGQMGHERKPWVRDAARYILRGSGTGSVDPFALAIIVS